MWETTGWAIGTWLRITVIMAVLVGVAWLILGTDSAWFWAITAGAIAGEGYVTRQLVREWNDEAALRWWWPR